MNVAGWIALGVLCVALVVMVLWVRRLSAKGNEVAARVTALEGALAEVGPLLADTRSALRKAENRNLRADDLVQAATGVASRADAASKFAYEVATNPVVRGLAWARGVRRGVESLRSAPEAPPIRLGSRDPVRGGNRDGWPQLPAGAGREEPSESGPTSNGAKSRGLRRMRR